MELRRNFEDRNRVSLDMSAQAPAVLRQNTLALDSRQLPRPRREVGEKTTVIESDIEVGDE
jgi:hypothetical protein